MALAVTFFELIAADRLIGGFKPAMKHILQVSSSVGLQFGLRLFC